uniref:Glycine N-acyltransferase-like protein n=1 Tax=Strongyloides venezuelensis TaxID=75913 RepID=A0A0K0F8U9_STRVS
MSLIKISSENFKCFLEKVNQFPNLLTIYHSIDTEKRGLFPCSTHFAFEGKWENENIYFVYRKNINVNSFLFIASTANSMKSIDELEKIFQNFFDIFPEIKEESSFMTVGIAFLTSTFNNWYGKYFNKEKCVEYPTYLYYMNEKQKVKAKNFTFPLPNGYYFDEDISDNDSLIINSTWRHARKGDYEQTRAKLKYLPFACIKYKGEPISFEMNDPSGFLNHQFTIEEHRRKGLGLAVELELSKKIVNLKRTPYKTVELYNKSVIENSNNSQYWTRWNDKDGNPVEFLFIRIFKN